MKHLHISALHGCLIKTTVGDLTLTLLVAICPLRGAVAQLGERMTSVMRSEVRSLPAPPFTTLADDFPTILQLSYPVGTRVVSARPLGLKFVPGYKDRFNSKSVFAVDGIFLYLESYFWMISLFLIVRHTHP